MPTKTHKQKIAEVRKIYEEAGFKCKEQYPIFNEKDGKFSLIDVVCFKGDKSRAFEVEVSGKHVLKNAKDLERFRKTFKNAKTCQIGPDDKIKGCVRR